MKLLSSLVVVIVITLAAIVTASIHENHHGHEHDEHHGHYHPYGFGYDVHDGHGNTLYRQESSSHPHEVKGSYGYKDKHGIHRHVDYVADAHGFRAHVKTNEPGTAPKDPAAVKMDSHPVSNPHAEPHHEHHGHHSHGHQEHHEGYHHKHTEHHSHPEPHEHHEHHGHHQNHYADSNIVPIQVPQMLRENVDQPLYELLN